VPGSFAYMTAVTFDPSGVPIRKMLIWIILAVSSGVVKLHNVTELGDRNSEYSLPTFGFAKTTVTPEKEVEVGWVVGVGEGEDKEVGLGDGELIGVDDVVGVGVGSVVGVGVVFGLGVIFGVGAGLGFPRS
jgi:hypothetical protein